MKGTTGYLKRAKQANEAFIKKQSLQKEKIKPDGIEPGSFKKKKSNYRAKRNAFILKLSKTCKTIKQISDALWDKNYHPFFTNSARDKYIKRSIKNALT